MMKKIFSYVFVTIILLLGFISSVNASEVIDFDKKGSIEITLKDKTENASITGAEITIYKVADAKTKDNNLVFEKTEELKDCNVVLNDIEDSLLPNKLFQCVNSNVFSKNSITNSNGTVKFDNLELGLYLITQSNKVEGYTNIESFLVMIPEIKDDHWNYNIKSTPKTDVYKVIDLKVNKVWNSNREEIPEEVTIELYKDTILIDTVILNEKNNWTYTWEDIEKDIYEVKEINVPKGYTPSYKIDGYTFTVTNTDTLAETGKIYYPIIVLFSLGIICISSGIILIKKGD